MFSKLYTRTGDTGDTSLLGGIRVRKSDLRVETFGTFDELAAAVGAALPHIEDARFKEALLFLMHKIFSCASNLASPPKMDEKKIRILEEDISYLERTIDWMIEEAGPAAGFVLPTGTVGAGLLHLARTICRRAERRLVALAEKNAVDSTVAAFINRASDFLFAAARLANATAKQSEIIWNRQLSPPNTTPSPSS